VFSHLVLMVFILFQLTNGGIDAYLEERRLQSEWLVEQLALD